MSVDGPSTRARSRQIWITIGAPILALAATIVAGALVMLAGLADRQDRVWAKSSQDLVSSFIAGDKRALANTTMDFAFWNDAFQATSVRWDKEWVSKNLFSAIADGVLIFRVDRAVRYSWFASLEGEEARDFAHAVVAGAGSSRELRQISEEAASEKMLLNRLAVVSGQLVVIASAPVSKETEAERRLARSSRPVDYLASIDILTARDFARMGESLGLKNVQFHAGRRHVGGNDASVSLPIFGQDGTLLGEISWLRQKPGSEGFAELALQIVLGVLLAGIFTIAVTRKLVARQLQAMARGEIATETSRQKAEFIATMSHELRTPLNAIIGYSELIGEQCDSGSAKDAEIREDSDRIGGAGRHLLRMINEILDHARIDAGHTPLEIERIEVAPFLTEIADAIDTLAKARGNAIHLSVDDDAVAVMADQSRLSQCLLNLASNAAKFTQNGEIAMRARRGGSGYQHLIVFDVSDTGVGIDKAVLDKLFTPFSQADASDARSFDGAGLGLSIARRLARAMGGDVTVESQPGVGSTFSLSAPAADRLRRAA